MNTAMKQNESGYVIKESVSGPSDAAHRREIIASKNTVAVAAAGASGLRIEDYTRAIEDTPTGAKSVAAWQLQDGYVEFTPNFAAENIKTGEFLRRMRDDEWLRANPHHPIAYMAAAIEAYKQLVRTVRDASPLVTFRRGKQTVYLGLRGDRANQRRLLEKAKFSSEEIERIIAQLDSGVQK